MELDQAERGSVVGGERGFSKQQKVQIGLIFAAYLFVGLNSGGLGVILPSLSAAYGLNKGETGLLFLASAGGYVVAAFFSGWLSQRLGPLYFVLLGLSLFGLGSVLIAVQAPLVLLLSARLMVGLAGAILETGGNFYVTALPRNTALLNYLHALFGAGALLGPLVATAVLGMGYTALYWLWLVLAGLLAVAFYFGFNRRPTDGAPLSTEVQPPTGSNLMLQTLRLPTVWLASFFLLIYVGSETCTGSWSYTFLTEGQHQETVLAGSLVSVYWLGLTLGRLAMGWATDRLRLADRVLVLGCVVGSLIGVVILWVGASQPGLAGLGLFVIGFTFGPIYPVTLAVLSRMLTPNLVPTMIGLLTGLSIMGIAIFPWLAGLIFEGAGLGAFGPYLLVLGAIMFVSGGLLLRPVPTKASWPVRAE